MKIHTTYDENKVRRLTESAPVRRALGGAPALPLPRNDAGRAIAPVTPAARLPAPEPAASRAFSAAFNRGAQCGTDFADADDAYVLSPRSPCRCVVVSTARGGIGCSTFAALLALAYSQAGKRVALIDADQRGGLEIVLGLEADPGLRLSQVRAPLGRIDPDLLVRKLLQWESVFVVPADPWAQGRPEKWEKQALWRALGEAMDVIVVDSGVDAFPSVVRDCRASRVECIRLVELSVLGIMREKAFCTAASPSLFSSVRLVGVPMRGRHSLRRVMVPVEQASVHLDADFCGIFPRNRRLGKGIASGLGIERIPRGMADMFERLMVPSSSADSFGDSVENQAGHAAEYRHLASGSVLQADSWEVPHGRTC